MAKRFLYGALLLTFGLWCLSNDYVLASDLDSGSVDSGVQIEEGTGGGTDSGTTETTGTDGESDSVGILEDSRTELESAAAAEVVAEEQREFAMQPLISDGEATQTDIYNILVNIHNLIFLIGFIGLLIWTYNMITKTFRRFI